MKKGQDLVLGVDFGTDSVRVLAVDPADGAVEGQGACNYPRWAQGQYCKPELDQYRQHPLDYIDSLTVAIHMALSGLSQQRKKQVRAISIDTTGSTPVFAGNDGVPLSLTNDFAHDPDAMFVLWKDHTSKAEAELINASATGPHEGVLDYVGGIYSSEWFWAKALHIIKNNSKVAASAVTLIEHCDWIAAHLTGVTSIDKLKRGRCAAGHKGLWHQSFGGYPRDFLVAVDKRLGPICDSLGTATYTSDVAAGQISKAWAQTLGIPDTTIIGVGAFDVHMGALGGGIKPHHLVKVIGTSCCDVVTAPLPKNGEHEVVVPGICGQVDGSIVPGYLGYEAGQSAFGDIFAWFKSILSWPLQFLDKQEDAQDLGKDILVKLEESARQVPPSELNPIAVDWLNGRRTPDSNQRLTGAFMGLRMGTNAPMLYRALIEAAAYGSRSIVERFEKNGVTIKEIIAIGGITHKSPLVMQILADVLNRPIQVGTSDQACALGASMFAACAAGLYKTVEDAQEKMFPGFKTSYTPQKESVSTYEMLYKKYQEIGSFMAK